MKNIYKCCLLLFSCNVFGDIEISSAGVYIEAGDGEGTLYVENKGDVATIVYAKEESIETKELSGESLIFVSPPISKLEPNQKQLLRIMLKKEDLDVQKIGRLLIQEVPYVKDPNKNQVTFNKSYNIPVLINPKGLVDSFEPWLEIKKETVGGKHYLTNSSRYLVKILPNYKCFNNKESSVAHLGSPYLKPNSRLEIENCEEIIINPITNEGQILEGYKM